VGQYWRKSYLVSLSLVLVSLPAFAESLSFIVNAKVNIDKLSIAEIRQIYLKEKQIWSSGQSIIVFDQSEATISHKILLKAVIQNSAADWDGYWIERKHTRGDQEPQKLPSDLMMLRMVDAVEGALGYVKSSALNPKVLSQFKIKSVATVEE
jgi:hypothetical protein